MLFLYSTYPLIDLTVCAFSTIASGLMNFASQLTNPGESMIYVVILLLSIHVLFNMKITLHMIKAQVVSLSAISNTHFSAKMGAFIKNRSKKVFPGIPSENLDLEAENEPLEVEDPTPCHADMVEEIHPEQNIVEP